MDVKNFKRLWHWLIAKAPDSYRDDSYQETLILTLTLAEMCQGFKIIRLDKGVN